MTIASEITRLQNDKAAICTAIENKGVTVGNVTLDSYASCIDAISAGGDKVGYIDFLMVGGGGGGGTGCASGSTTSAIIGGGGGAGGFIEQFCQAVYSRPYNVIIGGGGAGCKRGGDTVFYGVAYGGGAGRAVVSTYKDGASGGGGGSGCTGNNIHGDQGNPGGDSASVCLGGGGGGAGAAGCYACMCCGVLCKGDGGAGKQSCMSGENCYYAGGGGGAGICAIAQSGTKYLPGEGGLGGGGAGGATCLCPGGDATYYGGGGGGGSKGANDGGGAGYQGIVIIRYKADGSCGFSNATGGCKYLCNGYCIHCFTTDGIFTPII